MITKGGAYRKWYGNLEYVLWYNNDPRFILKQKNARVLPETELDMIKCTWTDLATARFSCRVAPEDSFHDISGHCFYPSLDDYYFLLALSNSCVFQLLINFLNSSLHYQVGDVGKIPVIIKNKDEISDLAKINVKISQNDWDYFETSWNFSLHPLIKFKFSGALFEAFCNWSQFAETQFAQLKANEEELNRIFIDIYGLQDEITPVIEDKDVTLRKADLGRDIRSFISYAVGCIFGRYSLDAEGLAYAGGEWDDGKYSSLIPDKDNILPITDEEYFEDDIVGRFLEFVKQVFGPDTLEENLDFIANTLGNKGNSSREVIRQYFLKDFFKNHCQIYQKRPIYWLFDSGKENGFKALIYLHRYDADTIGKLRIDYLHRMQWIYESEIVRMQDMIENSKDARETAAATKRKEKLIKQLMETKAYDEKIAHLALARIELDLDDGIVVNYEKVQTGTDGKKLEVLAKI